LAADVEAEVDRAAEQRLSHQHAHAKVVVVESLGETPRLLDVADAREAVAVRRREVSAARQLVAATPHFDALGDDDTVRAGVLHRDGLPCEPRGMRSRDAA